MQFIQSVAEAPNSPNFLHDFLGPFWRSLQVTGGAAMTAAVILIALSLWIFASFVSPTPMTTVKRQAAVSAWIGISAAPICLLWLADPHNTAGMPLILTVLMVLWTDVFAALTVGGVLRRRCFSGLTSPDPLSLPIATVVFSTITVGALYLFVQYGAINAPSDCGLAHHSPFSLCGWIKYAGFYVDGIVLAIIVLCGIALPADSNLIRANDRLTSFLRSAFRRDPAYPRSDRPWRSEQQWPEKEAPATRKEIEKGTSVGEAPSYPVPAVSKAASVDAMRLKLRRSQRNGFMGKMLFALDARIELTAEELSLVAKYNLGGAVIYESSSRERHRQAMTAHAESTREQPGLLAGPGAQLLGAGKTLFRIALTGASATALALSLRVTVYSLMQGVHIECKSMGELLDAENAIVEAAQNLKAHLQTAVTFDGREAIIDL